MSRESTLSQLLVSLFSDDELRGHLVAEPEGSTLCFALPSKPVALTVLASETVAALARRGTLDDGFFNRLAAARPSRTDEIHRAREQWAQPDSHIVYEPPLPDEEARHDRRPRPQRSPAGNTVLDRYRQALAAACSRARIVGMPTVGLHTATLTDALFIPLHLRRKRWVYTTEALLQALMLRCDGRDRRFVVLGDTGSGKTTLCRHLTAAIATQGAAAGLLPFFLPLREYVAALAQGPRSLLEHLRHSAEEWLSVPLSDDDITGALTSGTAVLLIDGIDEVGDTTRRSDINERIVALAAAYPTVALVVTSRIAGYDDAALPTSGPAGFTRYRIDAFTEDDLRAFVHRWYELHEPDDAVRRQRDIDGLLAALAAAPAVRALATNPLLATLIALIYGAEARLPADRPQLYERCLQLLLETWPAARRQPAPELDVDSQRCYLEDIAWHMLASATSDDTGPTLIQRRALVDRIAARITERPGAAPGRLAGRRLAERWIAWLERETGVLVEQTPGNFGFLHRSIAEYLSACHLDTLSDAAERTEWILAHALDSRWTEVALLHLGRRPDDIATLAVIVTSFAGSSEGRRFLALCMREELAFSVDAVEAQAIACIEDDDELTLVILGDILRCATRHASALASGLRRALAEVPLDRAPALLGRVTRLGLAPADIDAALRLHSNAEAVRVLALRSLPLVRGPRDPQLHGLAEQLWRTAEQAIAMQALAEGLPNAADYAAATVAIRGPTSPGTCIALAVALTRGAVAMMHRVPPGMTCLQLCWAAWTATLPLAPRRWPGLLRLPAYGHLPTPHETLCHEDLPVAGAVEPLLGYTRDNIACYADAPPWEFLSYFDDVDADAWIQACDPSMWDAWYGPHNAPRAQLDPSDPDDPDDDDLGLGNYTPQKFAVVDIHEGLAAMRVTTVAADHLPPTEDPPWPDLRAAFQAGEIDVGMLIGRAVALHAAQCRIAADALADDEAWAHAYAEQRQAHTWLWNNWAGLDAALPAAPSSAQLALYFALGWTQQTTTHRWPTTDRWRHLTREPAPTHAWPRVHWYLIRWFDDPSARNSLLATLAADEADPELSAAMLALRTALAGLEAGGQ